MARFTGGGELAILVVGIVHQAEVVEVIDT